MKSLKTEQSLATVVDVVIVIVLSICSFIILKLAGHKSGLAGLAPAFIYLIFKDSIRAQSPGKYLFKVAIRYNKTSERASFARCLLRNLSLFSPFLLIALAAPLDYFDWRGLENVMMFIILGLFLFTFLWIAYNKDQLTNTNVEFVKNIK